MISSSSACGSDAAVSPAVASEKSPPGFRFRYFALAALIQIVWGFTPSASRIVLSSLPVEVYSAIRYLVSGAIFLAVTGLRHGGPRVSRADLPGLILIGAFGFGVASFGTLYGLTIGGALNFALASSLNAVITATMALLIMRERRARHFGAAVILSIGGGLLLFAGKYDVSNLRIAGGSLLLIWSAYALEALGFVFSKRYKSRLPLTAYLGVLQFSAGIFVLIVGLGMGRWEEPIRMPLSGWLSLAYVCFISCGACYLALYWLLNHIEGHRLAFFDAFHTIAATVFAALLFHEPVTWKMLAGGALLLVAVMLLTAPASLLPRRFRAPRLAGGPV